MVDDIRRCFDMAKTSETIVSQYFFLLRPHEFTVSRYFEKGRDVFARTLLKQYSFLQQRVEHQALVFVVFPNPWQQNQKAEVDMVVSTGIYNCLIRGMHCAS